MQVLGWGIPAVLFAVSIPVTGVSYRLGTTCLPGRKYPFLTYLGWLMAFGILALLLQLATTGYCLWIYLREAIRGTPGRSNTRSGTGRFGPGVSSASHGNEMTTSSTRRESATPTMRKATWRKTKIILITQWRSILLSVHVAMITVLYGCLFAVQEAKFVRIENGTEDSRLVEWATCVIINRLNPEPCRDIPNTMNEDAFIATFMLASVRSC
jgi:hypothetical protein